MALDIFERAAASDQTWIGDKAKASIRDGTAMNKHEPGHIQFANLRLPIGKDPYGILFDELLAAFNTACALMKPWIAEPLLVCMEDVLCGEDLTAGLGLSALERLVEARFRLLEVRYGMRREGFAAG